jgi:hypothetical protein
MTSYENADGFNSIFQFIPSNAQMNFNFFQTIASGIASHGGYNAGPGHIFNFDFTGSLNHSNIDDASVDCHISFRTLTYHLYESLQLDLLLLSISCLHYNADTGFSFRDFIDLRLQRIFCYFTTFDHRSFRRENFW